MPEWRRSNWGRSPAPEQRRVPAATARAINALRGDGGRVIAVGTTVTRALESAADLDGTVRAAEGLTDIVIGPDRPVRVVDGLITGWHEPKASHLELVEAVAGPSLASPDVRAGPRHQLSLARVRRQLSDPAVGRSAW